ncbi:MAG: hypothetical protein OEY28_07210 [Nitrospira sp.]|nr:hypothetical protein [Nitrospira sp.]
MRYGDSERAVYYEQDRPLDRGGLIQKYLAVQVRFAFDISKEDLGFGHQEYGEPHPHDPL